MRKIIYYVATSIDGFIAGPKGDISAFVQESNGVEKYLADLQHFDTVIMGRKTYEFGCRFGLEPGQPAYPHMQHYIFSNTLQFENPHENVKVCPIDLRRIMEIQATPGSDIYLCGGGEFAGWLLDNDLIDVLKIKLNPIVLGNGIKLFGSIKKTFTAELLEGASFDKGLQFLTYRINQGRISLATAEQESQNRRSER